MTVATDSAVQPKTVQIVPKTVVSVLTIVVTQSVVQPKHVAAVLLIVESVPMSVAMVHVDPPRVALHAHKTVEPAWVAVTEPAA
jgi:hypothetical protein